MKLTTAILLLLMLSFSSCIYLGGKRIRGNGVTATQQRPVGTFSGIKVKGGIDVFVTQDAASTLKIEGDQNLLDYIEVQKNGDVLEAFTRDNVNLHPRAGLRIYASAPVFTKLYVSGSGDIKSQNKITTASAIDAKISGSGNIDLTINAPAITAGISGSGDITINGNTRDFKASIQGSGDIKCFNLMSETTSVYISGSGDADVFASRQLSVDIKGAGGVNYKGTPSVSQSIKGAGSVSKAG